MKKLLLVAFLVILAILGVANTTPYVELTVVVDEEVVLQKSYAVNPLGLLLLGTISKGDYSIYATRCTSPTTALDTLNKDMTTDLLGLVQSLRIEPIDASVDWDGKNFSFTKEKQGAFADVDELFGSIKYENGKLIASAKTKILEPKLTQQEVSTWDKKIASFTTDYSTSSDSRKHNIRLASIALDGYTLKRGGTLSFNTVVGERNAQRGYKEANVILNGEFVSGVGGGVCQVSTTLYNTALLSGLTVKSSSSHTLPVSYVPRGRDAMVSSATDLVIYNNTNADVFFSTLADGNLLTITAYSKHSEYNRNVTISTVTEKVIEATYETVLVDKLNEDNTPYEKVTRPAKDGYVVSTYITKNNLKTKLRTSRYKASNGIVEKTNPKYQPDNKKENKAVLYPINNLCDQ